MIKLLCWIVCVIMLTTYSVNMPDEYPIVENPESASPEVIAAETASVSWQEVFASVISKDSSQIVILVDVDFDGIPEMFTAFNGYGPNIYLLNGFKYSGDSYTEIVCDTYSEFGYCVDCLLSEFNLFRNKESGELIWLTSGFYRLDFYNNKILWNTADFSDLSAVKTELFFGYIMYRTPVDPDGESGDLIEEYALMEQKDDYVGVIMEWSEIDRMEEELFSEYERVEINEIWIYINNIIIGYDNDDNAILDNAKLMEKFAEWDEWHLQ